MTKEALDQMAAVDVRTVDISTLTDLRDIEIDTSFPVEKKLESFARQDRVCIVPELSAQETEIRETIQGMEKTEKAFLSAVRALIKLKNKRVFTKELAECLIDKIYLYPDKRIEAVFAFEDVFQSVQRFSKPAKCAN